MHKMKMSMNSTVCCASDQWWPTVGSLVRESAKTFREFSCLINYMKCKMEMIVDYLQVLK